MNEFIKATIKANEEVFLFLKKTPFSVLSQKIKKGFGGDISLYADIEAEKIFIKHLLPFGQIYSEESGCVGEKNDNIITIDPIDGSDNFISQVPFFGTSVALKQKNILTNSVVANLATKEILIKEKQKLSHGFLHEKKFTQEKINSHSQTGIFESAYKSKILYKELKKLGIKYRSMGALALSLSYAHRVDFVLYEGKTRDFDIDAGWHMSEDLYRLKNEKFLFVSKDKKIFDRITQYVIKL